MPSYISVLAALINDTYFYEKKIISIIFKRYVKKDPKEVFKRPPNSMYNYQQFNYLNFALNFLLK